MGTTDSTPRTKHGRNVARQVRIYYMLLGVMVVWAAIAIAAGAHKSHLPAFGVVGMFVLFSLLLADAVSVIALGRFEHTKKMRVDAYWHGALLAIAPAGALLVSSIAYITA